MTDNEIIKALEGMTYGGHSCMHCKYGTTKGDDRCGLQGCKIGRDALDLINRQQAEIERYKAEHKEFAKKLSNLHSTALMVMDRRNEVRAEAIKEFAERVKERAFDDGKFVCTARIDNLVKEMTEVSDEQ